MKILTTLFLGVLLVGCGGENSTLSSNDVQETSTTELTEITSNEKSHYAEGNWRADAADAGVEIILSFNADGTFSQDMAGQKQTGTWEKIDENLLKIKSENLPNGQTWKLLEKGNGEMKVVFASGDTRDFSKQPILFKAN